MQGNELRKKKVSTKKTSKISKKSSPRASDTGKGSYEHNRIGNLPVDLYSAIICYDKNKNNNCSVVTCTLNSRLFKKNLNASKPSEHPPQVEECLNVMFRWEHWL